MSLVTLTYIFSAGNTIIASQHNSNFSTIYNDYNGNITDANISAGAGIQASKINLGIPGPIGATTPSTGAFTTLSTSGLATLNSLLVGLVNQGDILYDNGTSFVRLTPGTSGQYLQTQGASANPQWTTITIPNTFKFISKTSPSGATNSGDISFTSSNYYLVTFSLTNFSSSDSLSIRINNDNTSNKYGYVYRGFNIGATAINGNSNFTTSLIQICSSLNSASTDINANGYFYIFPQATTNTKELIIKGSIWGEDSSSTLPMETDFMGVWKNSATATSFRIFSSGSTVTFSGDINLYQIQQA